MWTKEQIENHREAARRLKKIVDATFGYIEKNKKNVMEKDVQLFIYEKIKEYNLVIDKTPVIVAFNKNSANPHYHPTKESNKKLKNGDVIMIDLWARLDKKHAPFADITWMGFCGKKVPKKTQKVFDIVIHARDEGIKFIKKELKNKKMPAGNKTDKIVRDHIHHHGYGEKFIHSTGHSLGLHGPHGNLRRLRENAKKPLHQNVAYTIEPGIYLDGEFGMRSEIDFYVSSDWRFVLTTENQKKIIKI